MIFAPLALTALLTAVAAAPACKPATKTVIAQTTSTITATPTYDAPAAEVTKADPSGELPTSDSTTVATVETTAPESDSTTSATDSMTPLLDPSAATTPTDAVTTPTDSPTSTTDASAQPTTTQGSDETGGKKYNTSVAFPYGTEKIRGVNLGGWLLLESWITPTLFDNTKNDKIVDEYTFTKLQDKAVAEAALKEHWDTFITEKDFVEIAAAGLNHVRIPIGYWAYDLQEGETYIGGQDAYLEKSIGWAKNHGIKVLIDLHGAPGSQNGFDNSGQVGATTWQDKPENVQRTVDVIAKIAEKYSAPEFADTVTAIGLLNEPAGFRNQKVIDTAKEYFLKAYEKARHPFPTKSDESGLLIIISDALVGLVPWKNGYMQGDNYTGVSIDFHYYQIFSDAGNTWDFNKRLKETCSVLKGRLQESPFPMHSGEWSIAASDCARYLNGRGLGARYDGTFKGSKKIGDCATRTGTGDNFADDYKEFLRKFWDLQAQLNEQYGLGWLFWTWKNEEAAEWSYKRGMELGFIPTDPTQHKYTIDVLCA